MIYGPESTYDWASMVRAIRAMENRGAVFRYYETGRLSTIAEDPSATAVP
jgi:hypothetical protein